MDGWETASIKHWTLAHMECSVHKYSEEIKYPEGIKNRFRYMVVNTISGQCRIGYSASIDEACNDATHVANTLACEELGMDVNDAPWDADENTPTLGTGDFLFVPNKSQADGTAAKEDVVEWTRCGSACFARRRMDGTYGVSVSDGTMGYTGLAPNKIEAIRLANGYAVHLYVKYHRNYAK